MKRPIAAISLFHPTTNSSTLMFLNRSPSFREPSEEQSTTKMMPSPTDVTLSPPAHCVLTQDLILSRTPPQAPKKRRGAAALELPDEEREPQAEPFLLSESRSISFPVWPHDDEEDDVRYEDHEDDDEDDEILALSTRLQPARRRLFEHHQAFYAPTPSLDLISVERTESTLSDNSDSVMRSGRLSPPSPLQSLLLLPTLEQQSDEPEHAGLVDELTDKPMNDDEMPRYGTSVAFVTPPFER